MRKRSHQPGSHRGRAGLCVAAAVAVAAGISTLAVHEGEANSVPRPALGTELRPPRRLPDIPLRDAAGRTVRLSAFRGRVVVLSPFLTLCAEVCPLTTGAFMQAQRRIAAADLARRVVFVEVTVDPWRDTPARLRAFRRLIDDRRVVMLTGSAGHIRRFWGALGVWYRRVPQGSPPGIDWWTHRPETFDVEHSDALDVIDARGRWRVVDLGMPHVPAGRLGPRLRGLLDRLGVHNLDHPSEPWTVDELLQDVRAVLGRPDA
jgi:cytochrome oxidase Cu insertion factor (SCO1/SenC/PrrC family)